jgi:Ran GTPase-activating protein (RanGAP) involved in mRNA processing and transport
LLKLHWATADDIIALLRSKLLPIKKVVLAWYGNEFNTSPVIPDGLTVWATSFSMRWQWDHLPRLWACPEWAKVRDLWLPCRQSQNQRIAEPLGQILEGAEHLAGVAELSLSANVLDVEQIRALIRCPSLTALKRLHLSANRLDDECAEAIVARWPNLTHLFLAENRIGSRGARAIAQGTTRLELLDLRENNVFLPGMVALAQSPNLADLKELLLDQNPGDSPGASILAASPYLKPGVCKLQSNTPIKSDSVLEELETLPESSAITVLRLKDNAVTDRGLEALARNKHLKNVTELTMEFCRISKKGLDALAEWPGLKSLKKFTFSTSVNYQCCHGKDFDKLFRSPHWGELEILNVRAGHRLRDEGVAALAASNFAHLVQELDLGHHQVTDAGAKIVAEAGTFRALRKLQLGWDSALTARGVKALASATWPLVEELQAGKLTDAG